jgi:glutathione S-transferase
MEPTLFSDRDSFDSLVLRWMAVEKECHLKLRIIESWEVTLAERPFIQDRDLHLVAHEPMVQYLQERYPGEPLLPADPKIRAQIRQICWMIRENQEDFVEDLSLILGPRKGFIAGTEFTLADIYAGARLHKKQEEDVELPKNVQQYYYRLAGREAFEEAIG